MKETIKRMGVLNWVVIFFIILVGGLFFWGSKAKEAKIEKQKEMTSREVALLCTTDMATQYHIHPVIKIEINEEEVKIPTDIGIKQNCMTSIHTHSADGTVHVEAPIQKDFVLGDFFAVWQKDFSREKILDTVVGPTTEIIVTVNGEKVDTYENTVLKDKDLIVISYQNK